MIRADQILNELRPGLSPEVLSQIPGLAKVLIQSKKICCYGVGREGLMMKSLVMRLYHLGLDAHAVGDMTTPPVGKDDILFVSAGPGYFSTVSGLVNVAKNSGSLIACITAETDGVVPNQADLVVKIPAQTMAADQGDQATSILPMGSLYEALLFLFFELVVLEVTELLGLSFDDLRAKHTNLE